MKTHTQIKFTARIVSYLTPNPSPCPSELMSAASFQEAVQESTKQLQLEDWRLDWVLRYSIIVKSRGIIKAKGYLVHARKNSQ